MVNEKRFLATQPFLQRALEEAGVMDKVKARAAELQIENARKAVCRAAEVAAAKKRPRAMNLTLR